MAIHDVVIKDAQGKVKKIISGKTLTTDYWDRFQAKKHSLNLYPAGATNSVPERKNKFLSPHQRIQVKADCALCGQEFEPSRVDQKYCRNPCLYQHTRAKKTTIINCKLCGKEFVKINSRKYCNDPCSSQSAATKLINRVLKIHKEIVNCKLCGREFKSDHHSKKYCGDPCNPVLSYRKKRSESRGKSCPDCGKMFVGTKQGQRYCYDPCYKEQSEVRRRERKKIDKPRFCSLCKKEFKPKANRQLYCYDPCESPLKTTRNRIHNRMATCPVCEKEFKPLRGQLYCGNPCLNPRRYNEWKLEQRKLSSD